MKKTNLQFPILIVITLFVFACSGPAEDKSSDDTSADEAVEQSDDIADDGLGVGETTTVELNDPLDEEMIERGKGVYEMKCSACHKLTDQRVVGPGWKGLTSVRKPEWIMNMITNVDMMLEEDPTAQALLEECLTRMPNQNVSVAEARDVLEFMLDNDLSE